MARDGKTKDTYRFLIIIQVNLIYFLEETTISGCRVTPEVPVRSDFVQGVGLVLSAGGRYF